MQNKKARGAAPVIELPSETRPCPYNRRANPHPRACRMCDGRGHVPRADYDLFVATYADFFRALQEGAS